MFEQQYFLNENVLYMVQTLEYCEKLCLKEGTSLKNLCKTDANPSFSDLVVGQINSAIRNCFRCSDRNNSYDIELIKFQIFSFILAKSLNIKSPIPSKVLSIDLAICLMIDNRFRDFVQVIQLFTK
jgi:hypothetical protein